MLREAIYPHRNYNILKGIGAVFVFLGITLFIVGMIFSVVAYVEQESNVHSAFIYIGPCLMTSSLIFLVIGYILGRLDTLCLLIGVARRSQCINEEEEGELGNVPYKDSIIFLCFKCFKFAFSCCKTKGQTTLSFVNIRHHDLEQSSDAADNLLCASQTPTKTTARSNVRNFSELEGIKAERQRKYFLVNQYLDNLPTNVEPDDDVQMEDGRAEKTDIIPEVP